MLKVQKVGQTEVVGNPQVCGDKQKTVSVAVAGLYQAHLIVLFGPCERNPLAAQKLLRK